MTNGSSDRLDRIENDLGTVTQIMMTVARQYENAEERMSATDKRIDQLTGRVNQLTIKVEQLTERVDQTTTNVDNLAALMVQFTQNAEADRSAIRGLQSENRQILEYLFGQQRNGNGG